MRLGMIYCGDVMRQRMHMQFSADIEVLLTCCEDLESRQAEMDAVCILWDGRSADVFAVRSQCAELGVSYMVVGADLQANGGKTSSLPH